MKCSVLDNDITCPSWSITHHTYIHTLHTPTLWYAHYHTFIHTLLCIAHLTPGVYPACVANDPKLCTACASGREWSNLYVYISDMHMKVRRFWRSESLSEGFEGQKVLKVINIIIWRSESFEGQEALQVLAEFKCILSGVLAQENSWTSSCTGVLAHVLALELCYCEPIMTGL